jgi:hypothetical protein
MFCGIGGNNKDKGRRGTAAGGAIPRPIAVTKSDIKVEETEPDTLGEDVLQMGYLKVRMLSMRDQLVWVNRLCVLSRVAFTVYLETKPHVKDQNSVTKVSIPILQELQNGEQPASMTMQQIDESLKETYMTILNN